jgi:hypothetical protein
MWMRAVRRVSKHAKDGELLIADEHTMLSHKLPISGGCLTAAAV